MPTPGETKIASVTYIDSDGFETVVEARMGQDLIGVAVAAGVEGIVGECDGNLMCATCHVFVDADWPSRLPEQQAVEVEMLECTAVPRRLNSRLASHLFVDDELDAWSFVCRSSSCEVRSGMVIRARN